MRGLSLEMQRRIRGRAHRFDLPALRSLLARHGIGDDGVRYRSNPGITFRPWLIEDIEFGAAEVVVTVTHGLVSAQSPLPGYLQDRILRDEGGLKQLVAFLDHWLLQDRVGGLRPERDERRLPGFRALQTPLLRPLRLEAPARVEWLVPPPFPD